MHCPLSQLSRSVWARGLNGVFDDIRMRSLFVNHFKKLPLYNFLLVNFLYFCIPITIRRILNSPQNE